MARKIYDIKPPKTAKKVGKPDATMIVSRTLGGEARKNTRKKKERRSIFGNPWAVISISILTLLVIVGVYLFFKLPKADIVIWPKVDTLSFSQTITADKSVAVSDFVKFIIPAQYFEATKTNSQDFPATGNASNEGRATGTITIYNKYDPPTPVNFKTGTHFMSDSGKLFVASQKIVVPAAKKSGSKITPGSVQVEIQAVEGGSDYNIAPSNFSVPGLKGTSYYYSINAVSTSAMTGGYAGKVKKVTDDDIQQAKDVLVKKTTSDAMADLKSQISSEYILLDNAALSSVVEALSPTKPGTVAESFSYQVTVKASALVFKKSEVEELVKNYVTSQMPEGKTLLANSSQISYPSSTIDISGGKATLNLDFSSGVYQNMDKNSMTLSMLGQNASQIEEKIKNSFGDQVSKVTISFWPFWVTSAPNNQKVVNIELKFQ